MSLFCDAANIWELKRLVAQQMQYHNCRRRHSALGYTAPMDYIIREEILPQTAFGLASLGSQTGAGFQPHVPTQYPLLTSWYRELP